MRSLVLLALLLAGCVHAAPVARQTPAECETLFVVLPGNFIVDLAAGAHVILNPAVEEFICYCTQQSAQKALREASLSGDWRVYRLRGKFAEIAEMAENGQPRLAAPAEVADWLE